MALIEFQNNTSPYLNANNLNNNFNYLDEKIDNQNVYSTNEIVIGKWLGKPLYRKIYNFGSLPNNDTKNVLSGLTNISIVKIYGIATEETGTYLPLPYATSTDLANIIALNYSGSNEISIRTGTNRTQVTAYVVLEYTKTTDEGDE